MSAPSAWTINNVMSIASSLASRLEQDGVTTDESELLAYLRDEGADVETLILRLINAEREARADEVLIARRVADLLTRKARAGRVRTQCRGAIIGIFEALDIRAWKHAEASASLYAGKQSVAIDNEELLPKKFVLTQTYPDRDEIAAALKRGDTVPGAEMRAGPTTITIRTT